MEVRRLYGMTRDPDKKGLQTVFGEEGRLVYSMGRTTLSM